MFNTLFNPQPNFSYPLMRDPEQQPKCYEMTDEDRAAALIQSDARLQDCIAGQVPNYWGA